MLVVAVLACGAWAAGPVAANAAGPQRADDQGPVKAAQVQQGGPDIEPQVCSSCRPPLTYSGGPVMSTNTAAGLTVTPIYWAPTGYPFPANYENIINGFIANVAAASGTTDNVFSVATEYYQTVDGTKSFVSDDYHAGSPVVDTDAFPANGCTPASGYTACITDAQLRTELTKVLTSQGLPSDLAHFYPVFFPPNVETQDSDGTNSVNDYCGYHRAYGSGTAQTVYADMPYEASGCDGGQAPNGNLQADGEVSTLSHELNEAVTDPLSQPTAWTDAQGNEIADMCAQTYGGALGSTNPSDPSGSEYNQVINGGKYYLQQEFSNLAFGKSGKGCALSEALAEHPSASGTGTGATTVVALFSDATPTTLSAAGDTSSVVVTATDPAGNGVPGDHVHFSTGVQTLPHGETSGSGTCGTLSSTDVTTDANGDATVTYTASTSNLACWVLAVDAEGGRSAQAVIYQGTLAKFSPTLVATFPTVLHAGGSTTTFTIKAANPSSAPLPDARVDFAVFAGTSSSKNVEASQVHLSYSTTGPNGTFTNVPLSGSTSDGNVIDGFLGAQQGATMAPRSSQTYTFHVTLAPGTPTSNSTPAIAFEAYLNQYDSAAGSGITVSDTYATNIKVLPATSDTLRTVLIALAIVVVVALAVVGWLLWRRHQARPQVPTAGQTTGA